MYSSSPTWRGAGNSPRGSAFPQSARFRPTTSQGFFPTSVRGFPTSEFPSTLRTQALEASLQQPLFKKPGVKQNLSETRNAICETLRKANLKRRQQTEKLLQRKCPTTAQKRVDTEPAERVTLSKSPVVERLPAALQLRIVASEMWGKTEEKEDRERFEPKTHRDMTEYLETVQRNQRKQRRDKALAAIKHFAKLQVPAFLIPKLSSLVPKHPFARKHSLKFIMACRSGDAQQVHQFLDLDRWLVLETDNVGQTGLHWAARRNSGDTMEILVRMGAFIDAKDSLGRTPLFLASKEGNIAAVRYLLTQRANPFLRTYQNHSPISVAANLIVEKLLMRCMQLVLLMKFAPASKRDGVWEKEGLGFFQADADVIKKS